MVSHGIDELVWQALTDGEFRDAILNGPRQELAKTAGLTKAEQEHVMLVRAETLEAFAAALCL